MDVATFGPEVDDDVEVPPAFLAVRGDLVYRCLVERLVSTRKVRLLRLGVEHVSAVPVRHGGGRWLLGIVRWRGTGEEVAPSAFFVAGVVGKEVLEQARRCLAGRHGCCSSVRGESSKKEGRGLLGGWRGVAVEAEAAADAETETETGWVEG